jgi:transposase
LCWEVVWVRELSVAEQRYRAVLAVIEDGLSVTEAAAKVGVSRQTMHGWLGRYAGSGWRAWPTGRVGCGRARIR